MAKRKENLKAKISIIPYKDNDKLVGIELIVNEKYVDDKISEDEDFFLTKKGFWHPEYHAWKFFYYDAKVFQQVIDKIFDGKFDYISELREKCKKEGVKVDF